MSTDEYVPSEKAVRASYRLYMVHSGIPDADAEFDRFLARVRRDAWDEGGAHVEGRGGHYDPDDNPYRETGGSDEHR